MDYKYINQLLERYWRGETTLEEESILRSFFGQDRMPAELKRWQPLFAYEAREPQADVLGEGFDEKLLAMVGEEEPRVVTARVITMAERLKPLLKAAAFLAIVLTLGNAIQVPFEQNQGDPISTYDGYHKPELDHGTSVAIGDTATTDTMQQRMMMPAKGAELPITK